MTFTYTEDINSGMRPLSADLDAENDIADYLAEDAEEIPVGIVAAEDDEDDDECTGEEDTASRNLPVGAAAVGGFLGFCIGGIGGAAFLAGR